MAAEPLVQSPIAFAWGPDGKLWVVEMGDYPLGIDGKGKPGGRVKYLEDTNGDGTYDKATVFLDDLPLPHRRPALAQRRARHLRPGHLLRRGHQRRRQGRQERRRSSPASARAISSTASTAWSGASTTGSTCANGDSGGKVKSVKTGKDVDISGRDFRIRPDDGELEPQTGQTQYGRSRDDWGNWFGNNNSKPMYHFVLDDHYLRRNPHFAAAEPRVQVSVTPGAAPVYPISRTVAALQRSRGGQPLHLGVQRHRLSRRPVRARTSPTARSSASRSTTWSIAKS